MKRLDRVSDRVKGRVSANSWNLIRNVWYSSRHYALDHLYERVWYRINARVWSRIWFRTIREGLVQR